MTRIIYSFNRAGGGGLAPTFLGGKLYITLTEYLFIFFIFFYKSSPPPQIHSQFASDATAPRRLKIQHDNTTFTLGEFSLSCN